MEKRIRRNRWVAVVMSAMMALTLAVTAGGVATAQDEVEKVIIDSDLNFLTDDNMAILMLLQADDVVDVLGITAAMPNPSLEQGMANTLRVLEAAGKTDVGVYPGSVIPLVRPAEIPESEPLTPPPGGFASAQPKTEHAVDYMVDTIKSDPGQISIVALGPLTNVALALRKDPTIADDIKAIYMMGGQYNISNGRIQPWEAGEVADLSEYNIRTDAEAAYVVLHSGVPITIAPLELGRWVKIRQEHLDRIVEAGTPVAELFRHPGPFFEYKIQPDDPASGWDYTYDEMAALAVVQPDLLTSKDVAVDVITSGPAYGQTVAYTRNAPEDAVSVELLYDVDYDAFMDLFIGLMTK